MLKNNVSLWGGQNKGFVVLAMELWNRYMYEILTGLIAAFATYMFVFTNKIPNWDDTQYLFAKGASLSSGRWGLDILAQVLPNISIPWLWGWCSILILIPIVCLILDMFQINNKLLRCILSGIIVTFPSEAGTMLYMFTSTSYAIAFACSVLAVYFFEKRTVTYWLIAIVLAVFSLSIYQAYIAITASFFILKMIQMLLREKTVMTVIRRGVAYLGFLVAVLAIYCGATYVILTISGTELNSWAIRATSTSNSVFHRIIRSWKLFVAMIVYREYGLVTGTYSWIAHICCMLCTAYAIAQCAIKKMNLLEILMLSVLGGILLPLSINAMVLLIGENGVHALTLYSFISVYLLVAVVVGCCSMTLAAKRVIVVSLSVIMMSNIYAANKAYFRQYMVYENTVAFYSSIVTQIQMTPGFDENCSVAIIGNIAQDSDYLSNFGEEPIYGLNGFKGYDISGEFIKHYLGIDFSYADADTIEEIRESADYVQMPSYPYFGYIQKIGDNIVVKIGE